MITAVVFVLISLVIIFQDEIQEHKLTKAKFEIMDRMLNNEPEQWPADIRQVIDSLVLEKKDTLISDIQVKG